MSTRVWSMLIAATVFIFDRLTKILIERYVSIWDTHSVIPGFFNIVHTKNRGAAFGMFSDGDNQVRTFLLIGVSVVVLLFISSILLRPGSAGSFGGSRLTTIGLSLVLGGAFGNIYDRIAYVMVTDFLEFYAGAYHFAAFNIADSAISIGAGLLLIDMWRNRHETVRT
jgi:signal peptidase II